MSVDLNRTVFLINDLNQLEVIGAFNQQSSPESSSEAKIQFTHPITDCHVSSHDQFVILQQEESLLFFPHRDKYTHYKSKAKLLQIITIKEENCFIIKSRDGPNVSFEKFDYNENRTIWKSTQKEEEGDDHPDETPDNTGRYEYNPITKQLITVWNRQYLCLWDIETGIK